MSFLASRNYLFSCLVKLLVLCGAFPGSVSATPEHVDETNELEVVSYSLVSEKSVGSKSSNFDKLFIYRVELKNTGPCALSRIVAKADTRRDDLKIVSRKVFLRLLKPEQSRFAVGKLLVFAKEGTGYNPSEDIKWTFYALSKSCLVLKPIDSPQLVNVGENLNIDLEAIQRACKSKKGFWYARGNKIRTKSSCKKSFSFSPGLENTVFDPETGE